MLPKSNRSAKGNWFPEVDSQAGALRAEVQASTGRGTAIS